MSLQDLPGILQSWKDCIDSPPPGPHHIEAIFYTIVVNSPVFSDVTGNTATYIGGVFTQYLASPLTFSGGTVKATAFYSDKQDSTTGQPFDIKQTDELSITLNGGTTSHPPTITYGNIVYNIVDVRNNIIIAVLDDVNNPAVLTLAYLCFPLAIYS
jgi:hypothetical protein